MKMAKGTHKSMGKKSGVTAGLESGVAESMPVKKPDTNQVGNTGRVKPVSHGSISAK